MLERLDKINWKLLKHAYGSAEDVPDQIRNLQDPNPQIREKALWHLFGNIFHQGTRYQASPFAVPFLFEIVTSDKQIEKERIIQLLVSLALGYEEGYLPEGVNPSEFRKEYLEAEQKLTPEQRIEIEKYGYSPLAILDCYNEVQKGIPILHEIIPTANLLTRRAAIYALAWFPDLAKESIEIILDQLKLFAKEKDISNAILSIGLLASNSDVKIDGLGIQRYFESESLLVRVSAAIALSHRGFSDRILQELINGILLGKELAFIEDTFFNEGRISGYVSLVLSQYGVTKKEKVIPALCEALKAVNSYQALDITKGILEILNNNRTSHLIKESSLSDLSELEIQALTAILQHGGWEIDGLGFANYSRLLRSEGVPDTKDNLQEFLKK